MMSEVSFLGAPVVGIERMNVSQASQEPGQPKQPPDQGQSVLNSIMCQQEAMEVATGVWFPELECRKAIEH